MISSSQDQVKILGGILQEKEENGIGFSVTGKL